MKLCLITSIFNIIFFTFVNGEYTIQAKNVETLVIFSFSINSTEIINSYVKYFSYLASGADFVADYHLQLFFGGYNATDLLQGEDLAILRHPLVNINNITVKAYFDGFGETTKCNETVFCDIIQDFISIPRNITTQLKLMIISDICPDSSIFEEFYKTYEEKTFLKTVLVTKKNESCNIDPILVDNHFIPPADFNSVDENYVTSLRNRTIVKLETNGENYLIFFIKRENYDVSLKFIIDYINDTTSCNDLEAPLADGRSDKTYLITMRVTYDNGTSKDITTVFPNTRFANLNLTSSEYLRYDIDYNLKNFGDSPSDIDRYVQSYTPQYAIIFTDNYDYIQKYDNNYFSTENRTIDYILYLTSPNDTIMKNVEQKFYREENDKNFKAVFHIITSISSSNALGENVCQRFNKAIPFELLLLWWHWMLIGLGMFVILIVGIMFQMLKKNQVSDAMKTYQPKKNKELSKKCQKLKLNKKNFQINFNVVKGRGEFSTVYKAKLKRSLIPSLSRKSLKNNNLPEFCTVAAKILNNYEDDEIDDFIGEIQAVQQLGNHGNICTLLGWSTHLGSPCLFFEMMDMDLKSYVTSLRFVPNSFVRNEVIFDGMSVEENFIVPEFDKKQQIIFLQILWQISQGMAYIASKHIIHRDVAARNILLSRYGNSETFTAKITDFGLCILLDKNTNIYQARYFNRLPYKWLAIESLVDKIFSQASDVWAFGIMMIEIYSLGGMLYPGVGSNEIIYYLKHDKRMEKPDKMPQELYDLAFTCWDANPYSRKPFSKLCLEFKRMLRELDPCSDDYRDSWQINDEEESIKSIYFSESL